MQHAHANHALQTTGPALKNLRVFIVDPIYGPKEEENVTTAIRHQSDRYSRKSNCW